MGHISTTRAPLVHVTHISTLGDRVMLTEFDIHGRETADALLGLGVLLSSLSR